MKITNTRIFDKKNIFSVWALVAILAVSVLASCKKENLTVEKVHTLGVINGFYTYAGTKNISSCTQSEDTFTIELSLTNFLSASVFDYDQSRYEEYCRKFGDTHIDDYISVSYLTYAGNPENGEKYKCPNPTWKKGVNVAIDRITGIDIILTKGTWDGQHKAGDSIKDIFDVRFETLKPYLDSGIADNNDVSTVIKEPLSNVDLSEFAPIKLRNETTPDYLLTTHRLPVDKGSIKVVITTLGLYDREYYFEY